MVAVPDAPTAAGPFILRHDTNAFRPAFSTFWKSRPIRASFLHAQPGAHQGNGSCRRFAIPVSYSKRPARRAANDHQPGLFRSLRSAPTIEDCHGVARTGRQKDRLSILGIEMLLILILGHERFVLAGPLTRAPAMTRHLSDRWTSQLRHRDTKSTFGTIPTRLKCFSGGLHTRMFPCRHHVLFQVRYMHFTFILNRQSFSDIIS